MASSLTPNVGLSQWSAEDAVKRADFNADNAVIDGYLGRMGNATIVYGSYTGYNNGSVHGDYPVTVELGAKPDIVLAMAYGTMDTTDMPSTNYQYHILALGSGTRQLVFSDTGFTASGVMSQVARSPYHYMAVFLPKEDA